MGVGGWGGGGGELEKNTDDGHKTSELVQKNYKTVL